MSAHQSARTGKEQSFAVPHLNTKNMHRAEREPPALIAPPTRILVQNLPLNSTDDNLTSLFLWSKDLVKAQLLPHNAERDGPAFRTGLVVFKSHSGAQQAKNALNGKPNVAKDANMVIELHYGDRQGDTSSSTSASSSAGPTPRQYELPNPEFSNHYQNLFSPQSPIGNHLNERARITGKSLINNDTIDDDETGELIKDPISWAESGMSRRSTLPHLPFQLSRMAALTLKTSNVGIQSNQVAPMTAYPSSGMQQLGPISPTTMVNVPSNYQVGYPRHAFPPVNPADQNPPCNTLYVGNLPIDTNEDELKSMFSKQRGYKRLCFRTKQNGPMCFVEFEDVSFATKALHELYGHPLHNSIKGGIRLSFSKNPLGVRSGQGVGGTSTPTASNGMMLGMMNGGIGTFSTANGPPPGLAAPPGLGHRGSFGGNMSIINGNPYAGNGYMGASTMTTDPYTGNGYAPVQTHPRSMTAGGPQAYTNGGGNSNGGPNFPPYMMGR